MTTTAEQWGGCCGPRRPDCDVVAGDVSPGRLRVGQGQVVRPAVNAAGRTTAPSDMVVLPAGKFLMGNSDQYARPGDGEGPVRSVRVSSFAMDICTVTNADFEIFVNTTGYRTEAERIGWSFVFAGHLANTARNHVLQAAVTGTPWWLAVKGAHWAAPHGPGSTHRRDHPVVQVTWADANAYAAWAGKRLPTEAEWEYAARGGLEQARYPWGDELTPGGEPRCNIWQGDFPVNNTREDGYDATAPARSFPPNGYGLYNMVGNVWEWCSDRFGTIWDGLEAPVDPTGPLNGLERVIRGGSHLCHRSYCDRYRVAARTGNTPDSSTSHTGFRCVVTADSWTKARR